MNKNILNVNGTKRSFRLSLGGTVSTEPIYISTACRVVVYSYAPVRIRSELNDLRFITQCEFDAVQNDKIIINLESITSPTFTIDVFVGLYPLGSTEMPDLVCYAAKFSQVWTIGSTLTVPASTWLSNGGGGAGFGVTSFLIVDQIRLLKVVTSTMIPEDQTGIQGISFNDGMGSPTTLHEIINPAVNEVTKINSAGFEWKATDKRTGLFVSRLSELVIRATVQPSVSHTILGTIIVRQL